MQTRSQTITLSDALFPQTRALQSVGLILGASLLMAACSQITLHIPISPVPITGQTVGVLLIGATLGRQRAAAAMLLYIGQGAMGLPVFAPGATWGLARLVGPTGGYLAGFVVAAYMAGWLAERGWDRSIPSSIVAFAAANAIIYLFGLPWLAQFVGWEATLTAGFYPFVVGDLLKLALAVLLLPGTWRIVVSHHR